MELANKFIVILIVFSLCCQLSHGSYARLENNGYIDVVISIDSKVPSEKCEILHDMLISTITELSESLWTALESRAYFSNVTVIGPSEWKTSCGALWSSSTKLRPHQADFLITNTDISFGDQVYTKQYGGCGESGLPTVIPLNYLLTNTSKGQSGRLLLHHWAKRRYGVFDEVGVPGDSFYPSGYEYFGSYYGYQPSTCANLQVTGRWINETNECPEDKRDQCAFEPDSSNVATTSIMFNYEMPQVTKFCSIDHDDRAPTKQNFVCSGRSTSSVINSHMDFQKPVPPGNLKNVTINFALAEPVPNYIVVIDRSKYVSNETTITALSHFLVLLPQSSRLSVITYDDTCDKSSFTPGNLTRAELEKLLQNLQKLTPSKTSGPNGLTCALRAAAEQIENGSMYQADILLITAQTEEPIDYDSLLSELQEKSVFVISLIWEPFQKLWKLARQGNFFAVVQTRNMISDITAPPAAWQASVLQEIYNVAKKGAKRQKIYEQTVPKGGTGYVNTFVISDGKQDRVIFTFFAEEGNASSVILTTPTGSTLVAQNWNQIWLIDTANTAEAGTWWYKISPSTKGHVDVWTESSSNDSVTVRAWIDTIQETVDPRVKPLKIYAEVLNQGRPVLGAVVTSQIYGVFVTDGGNSYTTVGLYDTGDGIIDVTQGDGIYSGMVSPTNIVFLNSSPLKAIIVQASTNSSSYTNNGVAINRAFAGSTVHVPYGIKSTVKSSTRIVYGPAVSTTSPGVKDYYPPAPIRDFSIVDMDLNKLTITFEWTLPMDDYGTTKADVNQFTFNLTQSTSDGKKVTWKLRNVSTMSNGKVGCQLQVNETLLGLEVQWRIKSIDKAGNPSSDSNTVNLAIGATTLSTPSTSTSEWSTSTTIGPTVYPGPLMSATAFWTLLGLGIFLFILLLIFLLMICFCEEFTRRQLAKMQCCKKENKDLKRGEIISDDNLVHNDFVRRSTRGAKTQSQFASVHDIAEQCKIDFAIDNPVFSSPSIMDDEYMRRRSTPHVIAGILENEDQGYQGSFSFSPNHVAPATFKRGSLPSLPSEDELTPVVTRKTRRPIPPPPPPPPLPSLKLPSKPLRKEERVYDVPFAEKLQAYKVPSSSSSSSSESERPPSHRSFSPNPQNEPVGLPTRIVVRRAPVVPAPRTRAPHMGANSLSASQLSLSGDKPKSNLGLDDTDSYV